MDELFVKFPTKLLYDRKISAKAKMLYAMLIDMADENGCAEVAIPRLQWLISAKSDKTVRDLERELVEAGYITIMRTGRASMIWVRRGESRGSWSAIEQACKEYCKKLKEGTA